MTEKQRELLDKYEDAFDESLPLGSCFGGINEDDIEEVVNRCLKENKPYDPYDEIIEEYVAEHGEPKTPEEMKTLEEYLNDILF